MTRTFVFLLVIVAISSVLFWDRYRVYAQQSLAGAVRARIAQFPLKPLELAFEERLTKLSSPGRTIIGRTGWMARRADGSRAEQNQFHSLDGRPQYSQREIAIARAEALVRDEFGVFSAHRTSWVDPAADPDRLDPASGCTTTFAGAIRHDGLGDETQMLGYRAVHLRQKSSGRSAAHEVWLLPDFECLQVRRLTTFYDSGGSPTDTSDWKAVSLKIGEPPANAFQVPKTFRHVLPSESLALLMGKFGAKRSAQEDAAMRVADESARANPADLRLLQAGE